MASPETLEYLAKLREHVSIGVVGGSDLEKQKEQLGDSPSMFDFCFPENGLLAIKNGVQIGQTSFLNHIGEENLKKLLNFILASAIALGSCAAAVDDHDDHDDDTDCGSHGVS